jgi:hypothetical protein
MCIGNVPESLFDLTELTELILNSIEDFNDKSYDNVFSGNFIILNNFFVTLRMI